ncbi:MAG TPA: hypothetical protein VFF65_12940 [Phycisphaerales bacterium]|nr:hypothetical protein [Phycisphaerales bacterium]
MSERRVVAHQLSLLGDPPKPGYAWRPVIYTVTFCGLPLPLTEDARRQARMLHRESRPLLSGGPPTPCSR